MRRVCEDEDGEGQIKRSILWGIITGLIVGVAVLILGPAIWIIPSLKQSIVPALFMILIGGVIFSLKNKERIISTTSKIVNFIIFFVAASLFFILIMFLYTIIALAIWGM